MFKTTHIVVSVALEDAGEATRALALAKALRERTPVENTLKISFLSCGSRFEPMIAEAGFTIIDCEPRFEGKSIAEDLQWELPELVGSARIAQDLIEGQLAALRELKPDVVLHGMWPFVSIAARMLGIPTISFLPLPLHPTCITGGLVVDLPDPIPLFTRLPRPIRKWLAKTGRSLMIHAPIFRQRRIGAAATACGFKSSKGPISLFDAVKADITLVTDLPMYHNYRIPNNFMITGPIFAGNDDAAHSGKTAELDPDIVAHMQDGNRPAILVTMGSSGTSKLLFEAIKALTPPLHNKEKIPQDDWNVVVLASPAICRLDEAQAIARNHPRLLVTDRFIPGPAANAMADIIVTHGGQGTVQTAMAAGTPIVGVGVQMEQQINLDHVMDAGAGIRIQPHNWRASVIKNAVRTVLVNSRYKNGATALAETMRKMDGARNAGDRIWEFLLDI